MFFEARGKMIDEIMIELMSMGYSKAEKINRVASYFNLWSSTIILQSDLASASPNRF